MSINQRVANPPRYYNHPSSIMADKQLTESERIVALKNWRDDINLKLVASFENMQGNEVDVTLLSDINELLTYLEH